MNEKEVLVTLGALEQELEKYDKLQVKRMLTFLMTWNQDRPAASTAT